MTELPLKRRRRLPFWLGLALIALGLLLLLAPYFSSSSRLETELARLRTEGILVDRDDLAPRVPPGEKNAADLYHQAFTALRLSQADSYALFYTYDYAKGADVFDLPFGQWDRGRQALARRVVADNAEAFALLEKAALVSACAFSPEDPRKARPEWSRLHSAINLCDLRARVLAADGRGDEAVSSLAAPLRMTEHAATVPSDAELSLNGLGIRHFTEIALRDVLASGSPTPESCRVVYDQIAAADFVGPLRLALQTRLADHVAIYDQVRSGALPVKDVLKLASQYPKPTSPQGVMARLYPSVARPLLDRDEVAHLRLMERAIRVADQPWPRSHLELRAADHANRDLPRYRGLVTQSLQTSGYYLAEQSATAEACLKSDQIALALRSYRVGHGQYPVSLEMLSQDGWKVPVDPFTGKAYRYLRMGSGFLLYSLGPDGQDQGGRERLQANRLHQPDAYDLPFRCDR